MMTLWWLASGPATHTHTILRFVLAPLTILYVHCTYCSTYHSLCTLYLLLYINDTVFPRLLTWCFTSISVSPAGFNDTWKEDYNSKYLPVSPTATWRGNTVLLSILLNVLRGAIFKKFVESMRSQELPFSPPTLYGQLKHSLLKNVKLHLFSLKPVLVLALLYLYYNTVPLH